MSWIWEICLSLNKHCLLLTWQVQSLRTAEAAAAQKVQELQQLLAEASSDNPDSSRQEHVCGLLPWVATRRDAIESMRVAWELHFMMSGKNFGVKMQSSQASGIGGWASCFHRRRDTGELQQLHCLEEEVGLMMSDVLARVSIASIACNFVEYF